MGRVKVGVGGTIHEQTPAVNWTVWDKKGYQAHPNLKPQPIYTSPTIRGGGGGGASPLCPLYVFPAARVGVVIAPSLAALDICVPERHRASGRSKGSRGTQMHTWPQG